jgi:hypothetical protein
MMVNSGGVSFRQKTSAARFVRTAIERIGWPNPELALSVGRSE